MTPDEMHAAANKLRERAHAVTSGTDDLISHEEYRRAARMLDRLAADPTRDPVEALTSPPRRWALYEQQGTGHVTAEELPPKS